MLEAGSQLGPYEIVEPLGAGGMGEVYRAEDARLRRHVAIKVLPDEFAEDAERLARFEQEARAAAALNHPHIAAVYDVGVAEGTHYIVQELIEGRSLRDELGTGVVGLERALNLGAEIAAALAVAHAAGIVHRDLKPENIYVTPDGHAKVLDFGLAKLVDPAIGQPSSPGGTMSPTMLGTTAGQLMGTVGYMAPEQLEGGESDHRVDLFALGCLLYEMVTGKQPFAADNVYETLSRVVSKQPAPVGEINATLPPEFHRIVTKALAKDPAQRYQGAADLCVDLRTLAAEPESPVTDETALPHAPRSPVARVAVASALVAGGAIAGAWLVQGLGSGTESPPASASRRVEARIAAPENPQLMARLGTSVLLDRAGRRLYHTLGDAAQTSSIWVRPLDQLQGLELIEGGQAYHPFLSPDDAWLGFVTLNDLWRVPVTGGEPQRVAAVNLARGAAWSTDGTIVFAPTVNSPLYRVPEVGGERQPITTLDEETSEIAHRWPWMIRDDTAVLFTVLSAEHFGDDSLLSIVDLTSGERTDLDIRGFYARTLPTGHIVWVSEGSLYAAPFDEQTGRVGGAPVPVIQGLATDPVEGGAQYSFSDDGTLAYVPRSTALRRNDLAWIDADGTITTIEVGGAIAGVAVAPDDNRVAFHQTSDGNADIWVHDIARGITSRLTFAPEADVAPFWNPEGDHLYFGSRRQPRGIYRVPADGTGSPELVFEGVAQVSDVSPDGEWLLYLERNATTDLRAVRVDGEGGPIDVAATAAGETQGTLSPDGRWVAYGSNETGSYQIYVKPFPEGPGRWQLSAVPNANVGQPRWSADGRTVFFRSTGNLRAIDVDFQDDALIPGDARIFLRAVPTHGFIGSWAGMMSEGIFARSFDVAHDSGRILSIRSSGDHDQIVDHVTLVFDWFDEVNRLVPIDR